MKPPSALFSPALPSRAPCGVVMGRFAVLVGTLAAAPVAWAQTAPPVAPATPEAAPLVTATPGRGLFVETSDGKFGFGVRSRFQLRETFAHEGVYANEVQVKTLRLFVHGHLLTKDLRYLIQLAFGAGDFDPTSPSPIFDAFVDYKITRDLQLRVGQYFVVFDRARTIREFALQLVDRQQLIQELSLDRDVGLTLLSPDLFGLGGRLNYAIGVYGGNGRNRGVGGLGDAPGVLVTARLGYKPFGDFNDDIEGDLERREEPRLAFGLAAAYNDNTNRPRSTTGTPYKHATFDYLHGAADLVFKWKGFSLLGEALIREGRVRSKTAVVGNPGAPVTEWSRSAWGYLVQGGFMLTSKLEVAGRWDVLHLRGKTEEQEFITIIANQGREAGGGFNYYVNGHLLKVQLDYAARFGSSGVGERHVVRLQLDASF